MTITKAIWFSNLMLVTFLQSSYPCIAQQQSSSNDSEFRPQEKIIFEDDFSDNASGNFPKGWRLTSPCDEEGYTPTSKYCFVGKTGDTAALTIMPVPAKTLENYIQPDIQQPCYLPDSFTLEYDFFLETSNASGDLYFNYNGGGCVIQAFDMYNRGNSNFVLFNQGERYADTSTGKAMQYYSYKQKVHNGSDFGKWSHFALSYYRGIISCFINNQLELHIPQCGYSPTRFILSCSNGKGTVKYSNIRLATGNYTTQKTVEDFNKILAGKKLITHAIHFDVNNAVIKPQSMAFIKQLAVFLKEHPKLKIEITGHTDSDGTIIGNNILSQKRAEEVKKQLVALGTKNTRLIARGLGASQPISPNITEKDKANNRRVEFKQTEP